MIKKTPKIHKKTSKKNVIKSKLPVFYKILLSLSIFFLLILFYFVVLVSSSPRSINYVTQKIQENLDKNFNKRIKIGKSYINFTTYGSFKISINNINISYKDELIEKKIDNEILVKKYFNIPKIEAEFSIFELIKLNLNPHKIKIFSPEIFIENPYIAVNSAQDSKPPEANNNEQLLFLLDFLSSLRKNKNPIENFEIEDAKITFQNQKIKSIIIIKNSKISAKLNKETLDIFSQNLIYFANNKSESKLDSNCKLSKSDGLKCDVNIFNFTPNSIADFHPILKDLSKIETNINGSIALAINNSKGLKKLNFSLRADKGSFEFKDFFKEKIDFRQMVVNGGFDGVNKILNIAKIDADLISNIANQTEMPNPHLAFGLSISMLENNKNKYNFAIKLQNALIDEVDRFWPINLSQNGVRDWVLKNVSGGFIKQGFANFVIIEDELESNLQSINAQFDFANVNLNYDKEFPDINNLSGLAMFTKNNMKIIIQNGDVLQSKIINAEVAIDDFNMPTNILSIKGKIDGKSGDGLKHVSNDEDFHDQIDKYLNGTAQTDIEIFIPLIENLSLKKTFISVKSNIANLKNDNLAGGIAVELKKDFESNIFSTRIDLKNCAITNKELQIFKDKDENGALSFEIDLEKDNVVLFKNILLTKSKINSQNIKADARISGEMSFGYGPFNLLKINLKNQNFAKNNFSFNYSFDPVNSMAKASLKGKYFDASNLLNLKFSNDNSKNSWQKIQINVALDRLELLRKKIIGRFNLSLNCESGICKSGFINGNISKQKNIALKVQKNLKNDKEDEYLIDGQISDAGFVIEALGLSNLITGGNAKINIKQNLVNKKLVLDGEIKISSDITIFENEAVKKLSKDNLFSQVKDKIFSSEKTTFGSINIEFSIANDELNIKSLIANNFKIGVTAKGKINLKNQATEIKGMIVPGYIINSLFGLGKIPILGSVISGLLTGGEGGGIFSVRYEYLKKAGEKEGKFSTNKVSAFVPSSIANLFE
jgi:hypothetical protein